MSQLMVTANIGWITWVILDLLMTYSNGQMRPTNWNRDKFPSGDNVFGKNYNGKDNFFRNGNQPGQVISNNSPRDVNQGGGQISPPPRTALGPSGGFGFRQSENTPSTSSFNNMGQGAEQTSGDQPELSTPSGMGGFGSQDQFFKAPTPVTTSGTPFKEPGTVDVIRPLEQVPTSSGHDEEHKGQEPFDKRWSQGRGQDSFRNNDPQVNTEERRPRQQPRIPDSEWDQGVGQYPFRNNDPEVNEDEIRSRQEPRVPDRGRGQGVGQDFFRNNDPQVNQDERRPRQEPRVSDRERVHRVGQDSFKNNDPQVNQDERRPRQEPRVPERERVHRVGQDSLKNNDPEVNQNERRPRQEPRVPDSERVQRVGQDSFKNNDPEDNQNERRPRQEPRVPDRLVTSQEKLRGPRFSTGGDRGFKNN